MQPEVVQGDLLSQSVEIKGKGFASIAFPLIGAGSGSFNGAKAFELILDELRQIEASAPVVVIQYRR